MPFRHSRRTSILLCLALLAIYPALVLGYTWCRVLQSDLPGGRHGPLDAYRHTLASAIVAYTLGGWAVEAVTTVMESSDRAGSSMDRHNNRIGAEIGAKAMHFAEIEPSVLQHIRRGQVHAPVATQSTWLPPDQWRPGRLW